jgi:hypothetical protein
MKNRFAGHMNSHTVPFKCSKCPRRFCSLKAVRSHLSIHNEAYTITKLECHLCNAVYSRRDNLELHLSNEHGLEIVGGKDGLTKPKPPKYERVASRSRYRYTPYSENQDDDHSDDGHCNVVVEKLEEELVTEVDQ